MGASQCRCEGQKSQGGPASGEGGKAHMGSADEDFDAVAQLIFDENDTIASQAASAVSSMTSSQVLDQSTKEVGDHVCPYVGVESVSEFLSKNVLEKMLAQSGEDLGRTFSITTDTLEATGRGIAGGFACAISDPTCDDCPLVFVSKGFEDLTGYTTKFTNGRSCRFLQPTAKIMNDAFNLGERKIMREFCAELQKPGTTIVNLILNERVEGERFWNLLRMQYMDVDGHPYIFGVQTTLEAYMPKLLAKKVVGQSKNKAIVQAMGPFVEKLEVMRTELQGKVSRPFMELKGYFSCSMNYLQFLPLLNTLPPSVQVQRRKTLEGGDFAVGSAIVTIEEIKYPMTTIPAGSKGKVVFVTAFGDVTVEWTEGFKGTKTLLVRDKQKVKAAS